MTRRGRRRAAGPARPDGQVSRYTTTYLCVAVVKGSKMMSQKRMTDDQMMFESNTAPWVLRMVRVTVLQGTERCQPGERATGGHTVSGDDE